MVLLSTSAGLSPGEIVGIVLSALGLIVSTALSMILFWLGNRRGMAYDILYVNPNLNSTQHEIAIVIWNSGNAPIETKDYDEPITFNFGASATVDEVEVTGASQKAIGQRVIIDKNAGDVIIRKEIPMLNAGDSVTFKVKVTGYTKNISVKYHIAWITKFLETPRNLNRNIKICVIISCVICSFFLIGTIVWAMTGKGVVNQPYDFICVLLLWTGFLARSIELKWKRLHAISRSLLGIAFVILSYFLIHISTIAYLPAFLSLGK